MTTSLNRYSLNRNPGRICGGITEMSLRWLKRSTYQRRWIGTKRPDEEGSKASER
mgnify:CR=1 FL=1